MPNFEVYSLTQNLHGQYVSHNLHGQLSQHHDFIFSLNFDRDGVSLIFVWTKFHN